MALLSGRFKKRTSEIRRQLPKVPLYRPVVEQLEDRTLLDAGLPPAIVLGRTLSSYTVPGILNHKETITYTVYNVQDSPVTGVLLTDTLAAGMTIQSASTLPDQDGQNLAWSLGTIAGFDRASVTLTVSVPDPIPLQLDSGAKVFAMLDAGMVTDTTPAVALRPDNIDPTLLASTPDANITDPFIQEKAAELDYDPTNIFAYMQTITYNSYLGSVRGARGTDWSNAGNSLDTTSLYVALLRASGIPAQYAEGTLSESQAQTLILSMFPASYQTVGYIPVGTAVSDPAHDPQLLAETEPHYWVQYDAGSGLKNADPEVAGTTIGQAATPVTGTFARVPDALREKTEVTLTAETYSQADAAFGGTGLTETVVLDQTFNDVDLVGRPITVGDFVNQSAQGGLAFTTYVNTYSPYLRLGDDAIDASQDQILRGQDYQEILTSFPLSSTILTGLFLNFTLSGPDGPAETYSKLLVDRIGYAARQNGGRVQLAAIDPEGPPILTPYDLTTISALSGGRPESALRTPGIAGNAVSDLQSLVSDYTTASAAIQSSLIQSAMQSIQLGLIALERAETADFEAKATSSGEALAKSSLVSGYVNRPRLTIASSQFVPSVTNDNEFSISLEFDLLKSNYQVIVAPGQASASKISFNLERGYVESGIEGSIAIAGTAPVSEFLNSSYYAQEVFTAAISKGMSILTLDQNSLASISALPFSTEVKARILATVLSGYVVLIPSSTVEIDGQNDVAWYAIDPKTGDTTGIISDGSHGLEELIQDAVLFLQDAGSGETPFLKLSLGFIAGHFVDAFGEIITAIQYLSPTTLDFDLASVPSLKLFLANLGVIFSLKTMLSLPELADDPLFLYGYLGGVFYSALKEKQDPPLPPIQIDAQRTLALGSLSQSSMGIGSSLSAGSVAAHVFSQITQIEGGITTAWASSATAKIAVRQIIISAATVSDSQGNSIGSGSVALSSNSLIPVRISGNNSFSITGLGDVSFYGSNELGLSVSGLWSNYTRNRSAPF